MQIHGFSAKTLAIVFAILVSSIALETAKAQDIVGRISGTITDRSGAIVPGASVTITNEATGVSRPPSPPTGAAIMWPMICPLAPIR